MTVRGRLTHVPVEIVASTNANPIPVKLTGSILAQDPDTDTPVALTAVEREGKWYLATVNIDLVKEGDPVE